MTQLTYYVRRIRELGLRESVRQAKTIVADRAAARFHNIRDRYFTPTAEEEADDVVAKLFSRGGFADQMKSRRNPQFFLDREPDFYCAAIRSYFPGEAAKIIAAAEQIQRRIFDLLGSGPQQLPELPWHVDFKSGYAWDPHTHHREIRYGNQPGVDVKVPWELSRFQHGIVLGQAYWLTGEEKYAEEFKQQFLDWNEKNPCRFGVNWACAMDVGIRTVNWIWAFFFFRRSPALDEQFIRSFLHSLYLHARFIRSNLEYRTATVNGSDRRLNSNHYLSNLIGLLYIGLMFPELDTSGDVEFAKSELCTEILEQTYPDGVDYEHSTFYHRLVTEIFLSGLLLLKRNGHALPAAVEERLQAMAEYIADYLRPDGTAPQIGDADNGRLHPLAVRDMSDHRYIPIVVAETYGREDLRIVDRDIEVLWWIGSPPESGGVAPSGVGVVPPRKTNSTRASRTYAGSRFAILRCAHAHTFVSAAPICMHGLGSHSHNDILSFEYWSQGRAWIVDPGTYLYTPDPAARNYFRSTEAHNTVRIDQKEINPIVPDRLFQLPDHAPVKCNNWTDNPACVEFEAEHTGYEVVHRRRFRMDKRTGDLDIEDSFTGNDSHEFEWFFHVSPGTQAELTTAGFVLRANDLSITLLYDDTALQCENTGGWYSPSYGIRERAPVVVLRARRVPPLKLGLRIVNNYAPDFRHE
jgi:hypothetical protein